MAYLVYLRKSRTDTESGEGAETLVRHKETLTALARRMKLHVGAVYQEVVSGETIAARPEMQRLLHEVEEGRWDGVLVMEVERLARGDTIDQGMVARAFRLSGTKIITPAKTYDPNNEYDEEYFEFSLFMSRREYKAIRRRMAAGVQAARREGKYTGGGAPYGYDRYKLPHERGYSLRPNEDAAVVREIYGAYQGGASIYEIARRLTARGIDSPGGRGWCAPLVSSILHNPHYAGYTTATRRQSVKQMVGGVPVSKRRTAPDVALYAGRHEGIVSQDEWHSIQQRLAGNPRPHVKRGLAQRNAFIGLMVCGCCGRRIQYEANRTGGRLYCVGRCGNISHQYDRVEDIVLDKLTSIMREYTADVGPEPPDTTGHEREITRLTRELDDVQSRLRRAYDLVETGVYTPEVYAERRAELDRQRTDAESSLAGIIAERDHMLLSYERHAQLAPRIESAIDSYRDAADAGAQNEILRTIVEKIEYKKMLKGGRKKEYDIDINIILHVDNFW